MMSLGNALKGYKQGKDPNIDMMVKRYDEIVVEEKKVKKRGHALAGYCWKCKKWAKKRTYKICANGHLTYYCFGCSRVEEFMNGAQI